MSWFQLVKNWNHRRPSFEDKLMTVVWIEWKLTTENSLRHLKVEVRAVFQILAGWTVQKADLILTHSRKILTDSFSLSRLSATSFTVAEWAIDNSGDSADLFAKWMRATNTWDRVGITSFSTESFEDGILSKQSNIPLTMCGYKASMIRLIVQW